MAIKIEDLICIHLYEKNGRSAYYITNATRHLIKNHTKHFHKNKDVIKAIKNQGYFIEKFFVQEYKLAK